MESKVGQLTKVVRAMKAALPEQQRASAQPIDTAVKDIKDVLASTQSVETRSPRWTPSSAASSSSRSFWASTARSR